MQKIKNSKTEKKLEQLGMKEVPRTEVKKGTGFSQVADKIKEEGKPEVSEEKPKRKGRKKAPVFIIPNEVLSKVFLVLSDMEAKLLRDNKWRWSKEQADEFSNYFNAWLDSYIPAFLSDRPELTAMIMSFSMIHITNYMKPSQPIEKSDIQQVVDRSKEFKKPNKDKPVFEDKKE